jgi:hypothetical protein
MRSSLVRPVKGVRRRSGRCSHRKSLRAGFASREASADGEAHRSRSVGDRIHGSSFPAVTARLQLRRSRVESARSGFRPLPDEGREVPRASEPPAFCRPRSMTQVPTARCRGARCAAAPCGRGDRSLRRRGGHAVRSPLPPGAADRHGAVRSSSQVGPRNASERPEPEVSDGSRGAGGCALRTARRRHD